MCGVRHGVVLGTCVLMAWHWHGSGCGRLPPCLVLATAPQSTKVCDGRSVSPPSLFATATCAMEALARKERRNLEELLQAQLAHTPSSRRIKHSQSDTELKRFGFHGLPPMVDVPPNAGPSSVAPENPSRSPTILPPLSPSPSMGRISPSLSRSPSSRSPLTRSPSKGKQSDKSTPSPVEVPRSLDELVADPKFFEGICDSVFSVRYTTDPLGKLIIKPPTPVRPKEDEPLGEDEDRQRRGSMQWQGRRMSFSHQAGIGSLPGSPLKKNHLKGVNKLRCAIQGVVVDNRLKTPGGAFASAVISAANAAADAADATPSLPPPSTAASRQGLSRSQSDRGLAIDPRLASPLQQYISPVQQVGRTPRPYVHELKLLWLDDNYKSTSSDPRYDRRHTIRAIDMDGSGGAPAPSPAGGGGKHGGNQSPKGFSKLLDQKVPTAEMEEKKKLNPAKLRKALRGTRCTRQESPPV